MLASIDWMFVLTFIHDRTVLMSVYGLFAVGNVDGAEAGDLQF